MFVLLSTCGVTLSCVTAKEESCPKRCVATAGKRKRERKKDLVQNGFLRVGENGIGELGEEEEEEEGKRESRSNGNHSFPTHPGPLEVD